MNVDPTYRLCKAAPAERTARVETRSRGNARRRGFDLLYTRTVLVKQP